MKKSRRKIIKIIGDKPSGDLEKEWADRHSELASGIIYIDKIKSFLEKMGNNGVEKRADDNS